MSRFEPLQMEQAHDHGVGALTTRADWRRYLERVPLPRANDRRRMPWRAIDQVLQHHLGPGPLRVLEVGCGASAWLPYFAAGGHRCWGVDYSLLGCHMAMQNLRHYDLTAHVWCADVFAPAVARGAFDVVFSNGLVEHFRDPISVLDRLAALACAGGLVVSLIPNLTGWAGHGFRLVNPRAYRNHVPLSPADLRAAHAGAGLVVEHADYCGVWFPFLWSATDRAVPWGVALLLKILVHATARPVWALTTVARRYPRGRRTSPWILAVGRRAAT